MDLTELLRREAALNHLVRDLYQEARADTQRALDSAYDARRLTALAVDLPDGRPLARVSRTRPGLEPQIVDESGLIGWAREHYPTEVETRTVVEIRPSFAASLLRQIRATGEPQITHSVTGEIRTVPGVSMSESEPGHSVRLAPGAAAAVARAWQEGTARQLRSGELLPRIAGSEGKS